MSEGNEPTPEHVKELWDGFQAFVRQGAYETANELLDGLLEATRVSALDAHAEAETDCACTLSEVDIWSGMVNVLKDVEVSPTVLAILAAALTRLYYQTLEPKGARPE